MNVIVRFGPGLSSGKDAVRISVSLANDAMVGDLLDDLLVQYPPLKTAVAVIGGEHVSRTTTLSDGQEVALLLPIAGG